MKHRSARDTPSRYSEWNVPVVTLRDYSIALLFACCVLVGCSGQKTWPESPLYETPPNDPSWQAPANKKAAMEAIAGHYAHYDVVAYDGETPNGPLSTFIVSYGISDFIIENGELIQRNCFCHAEHKANQNMTTTFPDEATQAILPRSAVVNVYQENEAWNVHRPATPTLVGIDGDPDMPLPTDPNTSLIKDDDHDGKPGVTVFVKLFGVIKGEIYIARREIFEYNLTLFADGSLRGNVVDNSEQLVIGASLGILDAPNNPDQWDDPGLNPIILLPISPDIDTCEELMAIRATLFPEEPEF